MIIEEVNDRLQDEIKGGENAWEASIDILGDTWALGQFQVVEDRGLCFHYTFMAVLFALWDFFCKVLWILLPYCSFVP